MEALKTDHQSADRENPLDGTTSGIIIHERNTRHFLTRLLQFVLKPLRPRLVTPKPKADEATRLTPTKRAQRHCQITEIEVGGIWTYELKRKLSVQHQNNPQHDQCRRRIVYFAGGGWQMPPSEHHWALCAELVRRLDNTRVVLVSYPLAPRSPVSVAFPQIEKAYMELLTQATKAGEDVIVAGDSSGGNIALAVVTWALGFQDVKMARPPIAVLVISPSTDLRHEMDAIKQTEKLDPLHTRQSIIDTARAWCPDTAGTEFKDGGTGSARNPGNFVEWTFQDPRVSPILADLSLLVRHNVKVHGVTGSYDVLEPEAIAFRDKCNEEGVSGEWLSWHGQMHCFPMTFRYKLKESKEGIEWIIRLLSRH